MSVVFINLSIIKPMIITAVKVKINLRAVNCSPKNSVSGTEKDHNIRDPGALV